MADLRYSADYPEASDWDLRPRAVRITEQGRRPHSLDGQLEHPHLACRPAGQPYPLIFGQYYRDPYAAKGFQFTSCFQAWSG